MADLALVWDARSGGADLCINGFDFLSDRTLVTPVIISLFTDRRVEHDELPAGEYERRGYWGDVYNQDFTGSKLWLLDRSKQTAEVLEKAESYADDALSWLVEGGQALAINSSARWIFPEHMELTIRITLPDRRVLEYQFITPISAV